MDMILLFEILINLSIWGTFAIVIVLFKRLIKEYIQLKADLIQLINANPQFWASKLNPIVKELIGDVSKNAGSQMAGSMKPIKITGNPAIDGLATMFLAQKMGSMVQSPNNQPANQSNTQSDTSPFDK